MVAFSLVPLGTRLAVFLLRASDAVADPSPSGAVALIEEVRAGWRGIAALRGRGDEAVDSFGGRIASRLEAEVADARRRCEERGVNAGLLRGAMTEVEVLLEELAKDDAVVVAAVRDPDRFRDVIRGRVQRRRRNVEEAAEPFFDALVRAVTGEFVFLVLGSANFRIGALRQLLDGVDAIQVGFEGVKTEQEEQTAHFDGRFDRIEDAEELVPRRPSRVRFGSRPMEVSGFVERREQAGLFGAVLSGAAGRTVLTGMRGSGKSQLATAVAARCEAQDWELVAWVPAGSREAVLSGLAGLGLELGVRVENGSSHEVIAQHCLTALASAQESNRLIVFDDVDSPDDLAGLVPRGEGVRVLVTTTRLADWEHDGWAHVPVGVFEREQSIGILLDRTNQSDREAADGIAEALGDLPVAVVQAAATARRDRCTLAAYLDVLERTTLEEAVRRREGDEYPEAVGVALQLAFQSALERTALKTGVRRREEGEYPEAVGVALWLAFQGALERIGDRSPHREVVARVQLGVLSVLAATGVPARWLETLDGGAGDAREALSELIESSVCRLSEDGSKVMIRELQSRVIREAWKDEPASWGRVEEAAAGLLETVDITAIPVWDSGRRRREVLDLVEQLRATAGQDYSRSLFSRPRTAGALTHALRYAVELGDPQAALSLSDAVDLLDETLGSDHPDALAARGGLAAAYQAADRLEQAIFLFERTLTDSEHILGPNHPHTLTSRGNLANTYWSAGRRDEAIDLYEQNLADRERFLGPDHSCTLTSRDDLAYAYQSAGRLDKAVPLFEQILADRERRLGSDHTSTRLFRKKLADAYRTVGRDEDAEALLDPPPASDDAEADRPDD